jgi:hypothetical protein
MSAGTHALPLAPRWHGATIDVQRAGATTRARVTLENAGSATWRSRGADGLQLSYHWLDLLGNPVVWDGPRTAFPHAVAPGERVELDLELDAPRPPGRYVLRFDVVEEHHFWLEELGCATHDVAVDVLPRITERRLRVVVHDGSAPETDAAVAAQIEPVVDDEAEVVAHLVAGCVPAPDWSRLVLDAHAEGWPAVGPAIVSGGGRLRGRRARRALAPWTSGGRNPRLGAPLLLPSLLAGLEPDRHLGLPAYDGADGLFEGRAAVRLPQRSGRPPI